MRKKRVTVYVVRTASGLALRWLDEASGKWKQRSGSTNLRREAERLAGDLEAELAKGLPPDQVTWLAFCQRYRLEKLPSLARRTRTAWKTAAAWVDKATSPPELLSDLDASALSLFAAELRAKGKAETTIASYLRQIRAALGWAVEVGLLDAVPKISMPKRARGISKHMRSRPITLEEFERILMAAKLHRPGDYKAWQHFLKGLWHSGFRISELLELSWTAGAKLAVDSSGPRPFVRILAAGEKGHEDRVQPITPEFWHLISTHAPKLRQGPVFPLPGRTGSQMSGTAVIRIVSAIGARAGVVTNASAQKHATSHDIGRRAFTTQMGHKLSQTDLAAWMRHASPETTMRYYHDVRAEELAAKVWPDEDTTL